MENKHWIIRVDDGINFYNSKYPFWGVKRGHNNCMKTIVKKIKCGDILWFITNKKNGSKIIAMCEYTNFYDRQDEPLIKINTLTNEEQGWIGEAHWDLQLHYTNKYRIDKLNIIVCIQCGGCILEYETFKNKIKDNLYDHYKNIKFYSGI